MRAAAAVGRSPRTKKSLEQFRRWKEASCAGLVAPTFWDCWNAAIAAQRKTARRLKAETCDALIARDLAFRRENETARACAESGNRHRMVNAKLVARLEEMRATIKSVTETLQKLTDEKQ